LKITVVVPTYNEAENLPNLVTALFSLPVAGLDILVVDDNSADGTGKIAEELGGKWNGRVEVIHRPGKLGLGTAYIKGFRHALTHGADAIGQMDADFSHPPEKILELLNALETCDVALGSRYVPGGSLDDKWPAWRKGLSSFGNLYARTILGLNTRDVTGGFRLWRNLTLSKMPLDRIRSNGYVFQVEMLYVANKLGFKASEIPIHFADRRWGKSKMNFRIQIEAAVRVWQLLGMYRDLGNKAALQI
jgi:dolichol-phosphate mannosyltransferase